MLARKCDVCGKYHDFNAPRAFNKIKLINIGSQGKIYNTDDFDLCPDCVDELYNLIKNRMVIKDE